MIAMTTSNSTSVNPRRDWNESDITGTSKIIRAGGQKFGDQRLKLLPQREHQPPLPTPCSYCFHGRLSNARFSIKPPKRSDGPGEAVVNPPVASHSKGSNPNPPARFSFSSA